MNEEDDIALDGQTGCSFMVDLIQKNRRQMMNLEKALFFIGVTIYKVTSITTSCRDHLPQYSGQKSAYLGQKFFQRNTSTARSKTTNRRELCSYFHLPPGKYVIVRPPPPPFRPDQNRDFCLCVFKTQDDLR
ncbi:calpain-2 catalytic subunit-like [Electrophorus electricus]|uniref:calpain-2 catalytic subunit-like n=1 Tax=Electrophorus electricus TaxID=8005 RepID=UPI0015CFB3DA|nr:calpain-2 catalytic subunit-like [Electrophorus electricus]